MRMEDSNYSPPVDRLLTLGEPKFYEPDDWPAYEEHGIGADDAPQLMRMLQDARLNDAKADVPQVYAPVHAWRALAQLRVLAAAPAMLAAAEQREGSDDEDGGGFDEWAFEELPAALAMLGAAVLGAVDQFIADESRSPDTRRMAAEAIAKLGRRSPEHRGACVAVATAALERFDRNPEKLNTGLVYTLLDLKAVEAAPVLRQVYRAGRVNRLMVGDWREVRRELNLRREPDDPPELPPDKSIWDGTPMGELAKAFRKVIDRSSSQPGRSIDRDRKKAKRRQARKARRENRRHRR